MVSKSSRLMKKVRRYYSVILTIVVICFVIYQLAPYYEYIWKCPYYGPGRHCYLHFFILGIKNSLILAFGSIGLGFLVGLLAALGDVYGGKIGATITNVYAEFFRGSPLVVQCFLFYYTLPAIVPGLQFGRLPTALFVFTLNTGAYQKGYIKGAIESVYEDQLMAASSLGMSKIQVIRHVVLPQALRIVIPGWSNEYAAMTKSTSAAIAIGVPELTTMSSSVAFQIFENLKTYTFTAAIYFVWIYLSLKVLELIYERVKIPGFET